MRDYLTTSSTTRCGRRSSGRWPAVDRRPAHRRRLRRRTPAPRTPSTGGGPGRRSRRAATSMRRRRRRAAPARAGLTGGRACSRTCRPTATSHEVDLPGLGELPGRPASDVDGGRSLSACPPTTSTTPSTTPGRVEPLLGAAGRARRGRRRRARRTPPAAAAARGRRDRARGRRLPLAVGRDRPDRAGPRPPHRRAHRGRPGRAPPSTRCSTTSRPRSTRGTAASSRCASSSPTPPTSCARPLATIVGYAELARRDPRPGGARPPRWTRSRRRPAG